MVAVVPCLELSQQLLTQPHGLEALELLAALLTPPARMRLSALASRSIAQHSSGQQAFLSHMLSKTLGMRVRA